MHTRDTAGMRLDQHSCAPEIRATLRLRYSSGVPMLEPITDRGVAMVGKVGRRG